MNRKIFICPVCSSPLTLAAGAYSCGNRHSYDISKEGYVNLLLANQKQSRDPGDSKEMLDARKSFLNRGYYKSLARAVTSLIIKHRRHTLLASSKGKLSYCARRNLTSPIRRFDTSIISLHHRLDDRTSSVTDFIPEAGSLEVPEFTILDAGCGEGYYTDYISKNNYLKDSSITGIDISREGIRSASKRNSTINFAVAGIYHLPVLENSVDTLLNIFAPFDEAEFSRVLKDNGVIISVAPGSHHLYELKKNLYDEVYLNDEEFELSEKFRIRQTLRLKFELNIHTHEDISNLLKMTPYYHKSSPERIDLFLKSAEHLKSTADFVIRVMVRTGYKDS